MTVGTDCLNAGMSLVTWQDPCIDALDVDAQAHFWAAVTGLELADAEPPTRLAGPTSKHTVWVDPAGNEFCVFPPD